MGLRFLVTQGAAPSRAEKGRAGSRPAGDAAREEARPHVCECLWLPHSPGACARCGGRERGAFHTEVRGVTGFGAAWRGHNRRLDTLPS